MTGSLMGAHGEGGVEQQHALPGPSREVARLWHRRAEVIANLLEYVLQRRRKRHTIVHGEAQPVGLPRLMLGVLPYYHHLNLVERTEIEGVEDEPSGRITLVLPVFLSHEIGEVGEIRLFKFLPEMLFPAFFDIYIHILSVRNSLLQR